MVDVQPKNTTAVIAENGRSMSRLALIAVAYVSPFCVDKYEQMCWLTSLRYGFWQLLQNACCREET
jgi:hypothetical protein